MVLCMVLWTPDHDIDLKIDYLYHIRCPQSVSLFKVVHIGVEVLIQGIVCSANKNRKQMRFYWEN